MKLGKITLCGLLFFIICLTGCKSSEEDLFHPVEEGNLELRVSPTNVTISAYGDDETVSVQSNSRWSIQALTTDNVSWLKWRINEDGNGVGNGTFILYAEENQTRSPRHADIEVAGPTKKETISVTQTASDIYVTPTEIRPLAGGGEYSFTVRSSTPWTLQCDDSWISIPAEMMSGNGNSQRIEVKFTVASNLIGVSERSGRIVVKTNGVFEDQIINVVQNNNENDIIWYNTSSMNAEAMGNTLQLKINAYADWTLSCSDSWIHLDKTSGAGIHEEETVTIIVDSNMASEKERVATIWLKNPEGQFSDVRITVTQKGNLMVANISPRSIRAAAEGEDVILTITSHAPWRLRSLESWVVPDKTSGSGSGNEERVNVRIASNLMSQESRTGSMILESLDGGFSAISVNIEQLGNSFPIAYITPESLSATREGGVLNLSVRCFANWRLSCVESWVTLSKTSGTGTGEVENIKVTVASNTESISSRKATIFLESPEQRFTTIPVTLTQAATTRPVLQTPSVSEIGKTSMSVSCSFFCESAVEERGFYISTDSNFTSGYLHKIADQSDNAGSIRVTATGLTEDTKYYIKGYVRTASALAESAVVSATTLGKRPGGDDNPTPQ